MTRQLELSAEMATFQLAFAIARDDEWVTAPGLGLILAKHLRWGLDSGAVVIHHSGELYAVVHEVRSKAKAGQTRELGVVEKWERRVAYDMQRASPRSDRQVVQATLDEARRRLSNPAEAAKTVADILGGGFNL